MRGMAENDCDVLVVGSGAGGLAAALSARMNGLKVIVTEKDKYFGGTMALSAGWLWIPCSPHSIDAGIADSKEAARTYIRHESGNLFDEARVDAYLENGPRMVREFGARSTVKFDLGPTFPDYHPTAPGGSAGGRSIVAFPYDGRALGKEVDRLHPPLRELTLGGMTIAVGSELTHFLNATRSIKSAAFVAQVLAEYARDKLVYGRSMRLSNGQALAARLAKSVFDLGVQIRTSSPVKSLVFQDGRVVGAIVSTEAGTVQISARRGVVLATGGFSHDPHRRRQLFAHDPAGVGHRSVVTEGNVGDGLRLGEEAGGRVAKGYPNAAAWVPVSVVPHEDGSSGTYPHFRDRAHPGVISVTKSGRRFTNEANSYHDFVQDMVGKVGRGDEKCAWLIADHRALRRYGLGFAKPFPVPLAPALRSGYLVKGETLSELAAKCGIDDVALATTVRHFNADARRGRDTEFGRGENAYNIYVGDKDHRPSSCLGPIEDAPYYAVKVIPGDIGSFAGLITNCHAQVLRDDDRAVPGLYAVGNDAASIMGGNYPGSGSTLGPAMTFGYIAGRHLAGVSATREPGGSTR